jgi:hypothetical protein
MEDSGIFYGHLAYFTVVQFVFNWHIFPVLVQCRTKNLATLYVAETG